MQWKTTQTPIDYLEAVKFMEQQVDLIHRAQTEEMVWLLEHPAIYTAGSSAEELELINQENLPVYSTGRGGRYTYHGPGQRVIYLMLDLKSRGQDVRKYVANLENWVIASLAEVGIKAETKPGKIGIWTEDTKIAAIGIRVRKWIAYHGVAINVKPNLAHFNGIIPCGIKEFGVSSLDSLGINISYQELDLILRSKFYEFF